MKSAWDSEKLQGGGGGLNRTQTYKCFFMEQSVLKSTKATNVRENLNKTAEIRWWKNLKKACLSSKDYESRI